MCEVAERVFEHPGDDYTRGSHGRNRSADAAGRAGARCQETAEEREPEIVRLLASHYRALAKLGRLTSWQRDRLRRLIANCEATLADDTVHPRADYNGGGARGSSEVAWQLVERRADAAARQGQHQNIECLTAIRLYAAGARRALANGNVDLVVSALAKIEAQVTNAHDLISATQCASD